jgi:hypothetical protein
MKWLRRWYRLYVLGLPPGIVLALEVFEKLQRDLDKKTLDNP